MDQEEKVSVKQHLHPIHPPFKRNMIQRTGFAEKIKIVGKSFVVWALFCLLPIALSAQNGKVVHQSAYRIGLLAGRGTQQGLNVQYRYHVVILPLPECYKTVWQKRSWSLDLLTHPQFNLARLRPIDNVPELKNGVEFGLNCGLIARYRPLQQLGIYVGLSAGPHYVSATPARQARGFIFSDNAFAGMQVKCAEDTWIDLRIGFRHISNAGLREPNGGVNNLMLSGGCVFDL